MNNFNYYSPCNIYFGKDTENNIGALCKKLSVKKVISKFSSSCDLKKSFSLSRKSKTNNFIAI